MVQKKSISIILVIFRRSKVVIFFKKRKEIFLFDFDDDVELDVFDIKRVKISGKKVSGNVSDVLLDNIFFYFIGNVERWKFVY